VNFRVSYSSVVRASLKELLEEAGDENLNWGGELPPLAVTFSVHEQLNVVFVNRFDLLGSL
jgi:hypothetical protein